MTADRARQLRYNIAAFMVLFCVSLYRQISLRYFPDDPARPFIVYLVYAGLLVIWIVSLQLRVTQRSMRFLLVTEALVMLAGMTIRFLQDAFFYDNLEWMRSSGLWLAASFLPCLLLGLLAVQGIGQADDFRLDPRWHLLWIPFVLAAAAIALDERWHFFFDPVLEGKNQQPVFQPGAGIFLLAAFSLVVLLWRVVALYRRNRILQGRKILRWLVPVAEPLLLLLLTSEYFLVSLQIAPGLAGKEVIELFAKIYYAEILVWEMLIYLGLIPVNTGYREIFENTTIDMRLVFDDGQQLLAGDAAELAPDVMMQAKEKGTADLGTGSVLHCYRLQDAWLFWNQDVKEIQDVIRNLHENTALLSQESILLSEELNTRNEEASLQVKNQIYDTLTEEVSNQLALMKKIAHKREAYPNQRELLLQLHLLGTYVKRRCNLSLLWQETGSIREEDLALSLRDMAAAMTLAGIQATYRQNDAANCSPAFSLYAFDVLEALLEQVRFQADELDITADTDQFCFAICGGSNPIRAEALPHQEGFRLVVCGQPDAAQVTIEETRDHV